MKVPREDAPVRRRRLPVPHRVHRNLVHRRSGVELVGHAGGQRHDDRRSRRPLVLEALVALDSELRVVAVLALLEGKRDAVDPAVAFVDQRVVVERAVCGRNAVGRVRPGPVDEQGNELLVLRLSLTARESRRGRHRKPAGNHCRSQHSAHAATQSVPQCHFHPPASGPGAPGGCAARSARTLARRNRVRPFLRREFSCPT